MIVAAHRVRSFATAADFEEWLERHHLSEPELWLKIHKKDSGLSSVSPAEALDVCLCWGWIDGLRKGFDERSFLQRYTPRKSTSTWSQVNQRNKSCSPAARRLSPCGRGCPGSGRRARGRGADGSAGRAWVAMRAGS